MPQTRRFAVHVPLLVVLGLATALTTASSAAGGGGAPAAGPTLVGTWKMVKATFNGQPVPVPADRRLIKLHTATNYVAIDANADGSVRSLIGGTYTLVNGKYRTLPAYGVGPAFERVKGQQQTFDCTLDGNRWIHKGSLTGGFTIDEVWERVD
jgi:hypothetical protein